MEGSFSNLLTQAAQRRLDYLLNGIVRVCTVPWSSINSMDFMESDGVQVSANYPGNISIN